MPELALMDFPRNVGFGGCRTTALYWVTYVPPRACRLQVFHCVAADRNANGFGSGKERPPAFE